MKKPKVSFGPTGFPAFAGTMAVERVATGFRWPRDRFTSRLAATCCSATFPTTASCASRRMTVTERIPQPSMNSNGNTIDRQGRLLTCETQRPTGHPDRTRRFDHHHRRQVQWQETELAETTWLSLPMIRSGSAIQPTASAAIMRASKPTLSRKRKTSTGLDPKSGDIQGRRR